MQASGTIEALVPVYMDTVSVLSSLHLIHLHLVELIDLWKMEQKRNNKERGYDEPEGMELIDLRLESVEDIGIVYADHGTESIRSQSTLDEGKEVDDTESTRLSSDALDTPVNAFDTDPFLFARCADSNSDVSLPFESP